MILLEPQIIVVSGLPGVGKSTTAHELAQRFERAAHVSADRLQDFIVAGAVMPGLDGIDVHARWDWIDHEIRHNTERIGLWLDTTDLDPSRTVAEILHHVADTCAVGGAPSRRRRGREPC